MERKVVVVSAVVGFLGLLAAATGFAAEATRTKASDVKSSTSGECIYPGSPASGLGLTAAGALMLAQAIINTVAGCICCKRNRNPSNFNQTMALISCVISWVTFIIAFLLLLAGAALNAQRRAEQIFEYCYVVKPGVFSAATLLSLASVALGIFYYVTSSAPQTVQTWNPQPNQGIAMGQPVIPPKSDQPVFVHEDTYNRRQFP